MSGRRLAILLLILAWTGACSPSVDLKQSLEVVETSSGWFDAGIVDRKNKLVPSVTFRLRKKQDIDLRSVAVNAVFRKVPLPGTNTEEDWDEVFVQTVEFSEGTQTPPLPVRSENGYTGDPPQTRLEMLKNSQFRDMRVRIFVKHTGAQWIELAAIDIQRQLITR